MSRKAKSFIKETAFIRTDHIQVGARTIVRGDVIKIEGEHGGKFRFHSAVTNTITGSEWIDCFEIQKGVVSAWRSFKSDRIKVIPIKRGRRNVN